jgi:Fur family iron response transcriptional regulator
MDEKSLTITIAGERPVRMDSPSLRERRGSQRSDVHHRASVRTMLRDSGLRPTRQRMALGEILFARGHRHISAEQLHEEALEVRVPVSLATVYNTLHQFTEAGLLREVAIDGTKTYFDTNVGDHHHFFVEGENILYDIPGTGVGISAIPEAPEGMEVVRVEVVVRVRPKRG